MKKLRIKKVTIHEMNGTFPDSLRHEIPRMLKVYQNLYEREGPVEVDKLLQHRGNSVSLALFYGNDMELVGFAIAGIQTVTIDKKTHAVFSAGIYSDLKYNVRKEVANFALMKSLKYKLSHPTHQLGYLAEALNPAAYSYSANLLPECYPHPTRETPNYVLSIIHVLRDKRNFIKSADSDFVVSFHPKIITKKPENLLSSSKLSTCKYYQYYLSLNPDFQVGNGLLTYMPLTLKNILLGLKNYAKWYLTK